MSDTNEGTRAFIWDESHGMRDLKDVLTTEYNIDLAGWTLYSATGISYDGSIIVGNGLSPAGLNTAWLIDLTLIVPIDIIPGDSDNTIYQRGMKTISVAILSAPDFDARSEVDQATLRFGVTGNEASFKSCARKPKDVNRDGYKDLICQFLTADTGFQTIDTVGILKGKTTTGRPFRGGGTVRVLPHR